MEDWSTTVYKRNDDISATPVIPMENARYVSLASSEFLRLISVQIYFIDIDFTATSIDNVPTPATVTVIIESQRRGEVHYHIIIIDPVCIQFDCFGALLSPDIQSRSLRLLI